MSDCTSTKYSNAKIEFALSVLDGQEMHPQSVLRAAFFSVYIELTNGTKPKTVDLSELFQCLINALVDLATEEKPYALEAISILMRYKSDYSEKMLDEYHESLFDMLKTAALVKLIGSNTLRHNMFYHILSICRKIKQPHLSKYLNKYCSTLTTHVMLPRYASPWVSPEAWLALYVDILYLVTPNEAQKKVQQIESEIVYIGNVPIRKTHFLACCKSASKLVASTEEELIESVLKVFPKHLLDVIDPKEEPKDDNEYYEDSESEEDIERDDEGALFVLQDFLLMADERRVKIEATDPDTGDMALPEYLPYTQTQWNGAVSSVIGKTARNMKKLFVFKKPTSEKPPTASFIETLDLNTRNRLKPVFLLETTCAVDKIITWAHQRDTGHNKYAQRFLHAINARMMSGPIEDKHVQAARVLLETLEPHLDDAHLVRYLTTVVQILAFGKLNFVSYQVYNNFLDTVLSLLTKRVPVVTSELIIAILKLRCGPHDTIALSNANPINFKYRVDCLTLLTSLFPRASWLALRSASLWPQGYTKSEVLDQIQIYKPFHLKIYGLKRTAELYERTVEACVKGLQRLSAHFSEILTHTELAEFNQQLAKLKLYCELCVIDPDIGELNYFNQFLFDQHKIKNALIKANKYPGEMNFYSELLF